MSPIGVALRKIGNDDEKFQFPRSAVELIKTLMFTPGVAVSQDQQVCAVAESQYCLFVWLLVVLMSCSAFVFWCQEALKLPLVAGLIRQLSDNVRPPPPPLPEWICFTYFCTFCFRWVLFRTRRSLLGMMAKKKKTKKRRVREASEVCMFGVSWIDLIDVPIDFSRRRTTASLLLCIDASCCLFSGSHWTPTARSCVQQLM